MARRPRCRTTNAACHDLMIRAGRVPLAGLAGHFPLKGARPTSICHLVGWYMDGITVAENVHQLRLKPGESISATSTWATSI